MPSTVEGLVGSRPPALPVSADPHREWPPGPPAQKWKWADSGWLSEAERMHFICSLNAKNVIAYQEESSSKFPQWRTRSRPAPRRKAVPEADPVLVQRERPQREKAQKVVSIGRPGSAETKTPTEEKLRSQEPALSPDQSSPSRALEAPQASKAPVPPSLTPPAAQMPPAPPRVTFAESRCGTASTRAPSSLNILITPQQLNLYNVFKKPQRLTSQRIEFPRPKSLPSLPQAHDKRKFQKGAPQSQVPVVYADLAEMSTDELQALLSKSQPKPGEKAVLSRDSEHILAQYNGPAMLTSWDAVGGLNKRPA